MIIADQRFNTFLLVTIALGFAAGCESPSSSAKKQLSTIRVHMEGNRNAGGHYEAVPISRQHPVMINVEKEAFLTEGDIQEAQLVDAVGGFALRIHFDRRGALILQQYSLGNPGKHMAIFSQFASPADPKLHLSRWLGAPRITKNISDGVLVFTPDATREEADQIVRGLNNVAKKLEKNPEEPFADQKK
jgi:hypothetical protein